MAFAAVSKRAPLAVAGHLKKLLLAAPSATRATPSVAAAALRPASLVASRRLFSTSATPFHSDDDYSSEEGYGGDEEAVDGRLTRIRSPRGFSIVPEPDPYASGVPMCLCGRLLEEAAAPRRGCVVLGAVWRSKEDADEVKVKVAMPGLGKEHVKVWADQDKLMIQGEADKDAEYDDDDEPPASHGHFIQFPADTFKLDQIKSEMKDGVLMVTLPRVKREDMFQDKVE